MQLNPTPGVAKFPRGCTRHSQWLTLVGRVWHHLFGLGAGCLPQQAMFLLRGLQESWRYLHIYNAAFAGVAGGLVSSIVSFQLFILQSFVFLWFL